MEKKSRSTNTPATFLARVRKIALALDDVEERPSYRTPGFFVRKKLFARVLPSGDELVVRVPVDGREALIESAPAVFSVTPHYEAYPWVIINLRTVSAGLLHDMLFEAHQFAAPPRRKRSR